MPKVSHTQYELIFLDESLDPEYFDSKTEAIRVARQYRDRGFDVELNASTLTWRDQAAVGSLAPIDTTDRPIRFAELDLKPTAEMAANAARGLELREKHGKGGTAVGVARARDIKNRANLSPSTVRRMHSFFSRHEGNQAGGEDDAGYIAWLLWGGDAGKAWAARKSEQLDKSESARFSHDIRLPKGKRRLNIDEAHAALAQMGYKLGTVRYDPAAGGSVYKVTQPNGSVIDMPAAKLTDFIYEKAKHMKSGTKATMAATPHKVTYTDKSGVTHTYMVSDKILRDMNGTKKYAESVGSKPDYASVLRLGERTGEVVRASRANAKAAMSENKEQIVHSFGDGWQVVQRHDGYSGHNVLVLQRIPAQGHQSIRVSSIAEAKTKHDAITNWVFRATVAERKPNEWVIQATAADGGYGLGGRGGKPFPSAQKAREELSKMQDKYRKKAGMSRTGAKANMGRTEEEFAEDVQNAASILSQWATALHRAMGVRDYKEAMRVVSSMKKTIESLAKELARPVTRLSRTGAKAAFGLERSISIMLSDAKIPDSAFDWKNGFLIVDPAYHDRIVEVLKGYIPWELKSLPRIRKEQMSRTGAKAKFAATVAGAAAYTKNLVKSLGFYPDAVRFDTARDLLVLEFTSAPIIAVNCASKLSHALSTRGLGAQRVSINQSMEQRGGEDVGVVEINLDDVASRGLNSRAGAKTAFSIDAVKVAAAQVAKAYGAGADSAVIRKYLDRIVSVLSGNAEGGQREALGIHAQIGGVAEKSHGRDFMWSQPMQNLEKAIRSAGQFSRAGAKSTHAAPRPKFNLGDKVAIMDGGRVLDTGVIDYAYGYDDFQETYKYKVSTESGARKTWNEGSLKKMSRAGAKAAFAHPSWSAGILGKETAPQLAAYSWIDAHLGINGHRTQMLLADIAAEVHARNPALSIQQAIMKAAQEMVQKGVATYDIRALVEDKGWMSRAGAKSNGLTLAQRIAVEHDAKRMANR